VLFAVITLLAAALPASAQGVQTGTIRGVVVDAQGLPVPGATVTATSPALLGPRTAVTDTTGNYSLPALPPGAYEVKYELSGFATVTQRTTVTLGGTIDQSVTLRAAAVSETVQVVAETPAPIATPTVSGNFTHDEIDKLAASRTLQGITTLAPAVTESSPNAGQVVINGAFAWDNVFMINGVDVNDNLFAQPQNLFIEDAIEETQVLSSGISAEYGRFSGGVINAVTKSGGNKFEGSWRLNLTNPSWTVETPFEVSRSINNPDTLNKTQEATFGGPIVKDRLWFFAAGRLATTNTSTTLQQTGIQLPVVDTNRRGELKFTGTVAPNHTLQFDFLNDPRKRTNNSGIQSFLIDPHSEVDRQNPNHYWVTNYKGIWRNLLIEGQFSQRKFQFLDDGGTSTDITQSPIGALSCACIYNAPYFDATDPESRNNYQATGNVTKFWNAGGRHDTKIGYEFFRSQRTGGNSQSSTSYVFDSDFVTDANGAPVLDANGRIQPTFVPGESYIEYWPAVKGAEMNVDNNSAFAQDHWAVNRHLSTDLGVRFEQVKVVSTGNLVTLNNKPRLVPRLGLSYDIKGDGDHVVHATYAQYSGRYNEAQVGGNSPVGNPPTIQSLYQGPAGVGVNFAPGFNPANYPVDGDNLLTVSVPTANVFVDDNLKSALTQEFTASYGVNIKNGRGYAEASYVLRKLTNTVEDFIDRTTGTTNVVLNGVDAGEVTNISYENSDLAKREYDAMVFQSRYRITNSWSVNGHYTVELKNDGNYEGEGSNTPGSTSPIGDFPEAVPADRFFPDGHLPGFQRHRMRAWTIYDLNMGRLGAVAVSALWRVDSGLTYSLIQRNVAPTATQISVLRAAGYPDPSNVGTRNVYFGERGSEMFKGYGAADLSAQYNIPVFKSLRPWAKFDLFNAFNNQKLLAGSTTLTGVRTGPLDQFGIPTTFTRAANFGQATGNTATNGDRTSIPSYPLTPGAKGGLEAGSGGRTFRMSLGFRF
jgi:outer membrane receptor for ferrienterochelin and colicin